MSRAAGEKHVAHAAHRAAATGERRLQRRLNLAGAAVSVVGLGLLWRSGWFPLPGGAAKYGGDALWALLVYLLVRFVRPTEPIRVSAGIALGFAAAVEFSQLYHAGWIDAVRATRLGALALGSVFNAPDLAAYAIGIALGVLGESLVRRWSPEAARGKNAAQKH